ncbi:MAG: glycosyltransferase family 2 protein [Pedobacter sp.]|jgi:chlorobactene glucosyltransferase
MILIYLIYFFLILRFTVTLFNFISNPKLTNSGKQYSDFISILIPARDEEQNIINLLSSIADQDYQNYEVIVLDDHSADNTLELCRSYCETNQRFKIVQGKELPKDWLGKNYACSQLAELAKGKYLIFLDADEIIADGLINNAIHRMILNKLALLSIFTNQIIATWGERLVVPLMHFLLLNLLPLRLVRMSRNPSFSAASGQFMMFDADNYRANQWHEQVKKQVVEDIEIMKLIKGSGYNGEALLANGFIYCRMYRSFTEAVEGFSKNFLAGFNYNVLGLFSYLFLVVLGPFAIAYFLSTELVLFALTLIILSRIMISLLAGQSVWQNLFLHPVQLLFMVFISVLSVKKHFTKTILWKGRTIRN